MEYLLLVISDTFHFLSAWDKVILGCILIPALALTVAYFRSSDHSFEKALFSILCFGITGILFAGLTQECENYHASYIDQVVTEIHEDYENGIIPDLKKDQALSLALEIKKMKDKGYYSNANYNHVKYKVKKLAEPISKSV